MESGNGPRMPEPHAMSGVRVLSGSVAKLKLVNRRERKKRSGTNRRLRDYR